MQPLYLDVLSAHSAGYSASFEKFNWPISQQTYDSVARAFIQILEAITTESTLEESDRLDLALSILPIVNESFFYAGSHMIIDRCDRLGRKYIFSPDCLYYNAITQYRARPTNSIQNYLLEMQSNRRRGFTSKHISPRRKTLRRYQLAVKSKLSHPRLYQMTTNRLMKEWTSSEFVSLRSLASTTGWGLERLGHQQPQTHLSDHIAHSFAKILTAHQFSTDKLLLEYLRRISAIHLSIANFWRNKNHEKYFNTDKSVLLTATAGGFESRLMSHVFQRNHLPVIRFTHGGERGLINDPRWHYGELMFADQYLVHGRTEAKQVSDAISRETSSLTTQSIKIIGVGSRFHADIRSRDSDSITTRKVHNVMVVTTAFLGEVRPAFTSAGEDIIYMEWHVRLLKSIQNANFNVISKRHPKGSINNTKLFTGLVTDELTEGSFTDLTATADAFVFDFAASAFMEALCTNKPVVLIETPIRRLLKAGRKEVQEICTIVQADFDENNRIVADFDEVIAGLSKPVDPTARQLFLENYLLAPSPNLNEFTDLLG